MHPNVLLITAHDLGDFLGCYGHPVPTPHIDALAAGGVRLARHFSTSTVCSPARGAMLTGLYPHSNGLMGLTHRGWSLDVPRVTHLARLLEDRGYQSHLFGFQHEHFKAAVLGYREHHQTGNHAEEVAQGLGQWLAARPAGEGPWFAACGVGEVHRTGGQPSGWRRPCYPVHDPATVAVPPWLPDLPEQRQELAELYAAIRHLDAQVGEIVAALRRAGQFERTLIVFTTDHGASFLHGKATAYDGGTKVAQLWHWPAGLPAGRVVEDLTSHVDFVPTLLALLGLPGPGAVQGLDLHALLQGRPGASGRAAVFVEKNLTNYYDPVRAIRTRDWKYIRKGLRTNIMDFLIPEIENARMNFRDPRVYAFYETRRVHEELFDLRADPGELRNLASEPAHGPVLAELRAALDQHLVATDDPFRHCRHELLMPADTYDIGRGKLPL